ncbi:MAG: nucleotide sugar dehydrogenase [Clostridiales bacterium]|jgi:UDP-N-acetyl-D-mannosaminuronic acid dehydrogenase|nr:nucleotide sugar dehydrogenase [Clostridiales bacterium]
MNTLDKNINEKYKNVAVFGMGYVGLPLSLSFAFRGCNVIGVDVVEGLVNDINSGITHHTEGFEGKTIQEVLGEQLKEKSFHAITDGETAVTKCNNIIVTVGIPVRNGKHDLGDLVECVTHIGKKLKKGDLVIIRSTVIPGTTNEKLLPILERESGMKAGEDFYLAYSSERIAEGKAFDEFAYMPTVVGGINEESANRARILLSIVCKTDVIIASSIEVVEASKVFENVQRDVNLAMVQEFARFAEGLDLDIHEIVRVANTHKRVNLLNPGPGVGGYCIPNAYYYLEPKAEEIGVSLDILKLAREKNSKLPEIMVNLFERELVKTGRKLQGARVGVLGIAMKDYSNDDRLSPPIDIIGILEKRGAVVFAYDPAVPTEYDFKVSKIEDALEDKDGIIILSKQKEFDDINVSYLLEKVHKGTVLMDIRSMFTKFKSELLDAGILYKSV